MKIEINDNEFVREARRKLNMSRAEFAELLFMERRSIWRWEETGARVPIRKILAIQHLLETTDARHA